MSCPVTLRVQDTKVRINVSGQGLPGPPGLPGGASDSIVTMATDAILVPGTPVYVKVITRLDLAIATTRPDTKVIGLSLFATAIGFVGTIQTQDILTLTTLEWDVVTGEAGGLTSGGIYYLSASAAGMLTQTAVIASPPSMRFNSRVGYAISSTEMNIEVRPPLKL